jgi:hypothetical protein
MSVVVLAFTTSDEELAIYGKPVAEVVASGLAGVAGVRVLAASAEEGQVPRGDLVVELRVIRERRRVRLEAPIRDPALGEVVDRVATRPILVSRIDAAAADLARHLGPRLDALAKARRARTAQSAVIVAPLPSPEPTPVAEPRAVAPPAAALPERASPSVLLYRPDGQAAGGAVPVSDLATQALRHLLEGLGYRPLASENFGVVAPVVAARDAQRARAIATVMLSVVGVDFSWQGVLLAKGRVRVVVVSANGFTLLDRVIATDTVVGSRGDRHDALARFVFRQAVDILRPWLRRALVASVPVKSTLRPLAR